jgi:tetratricopeptide (TPR) repeat protein
LGKKRKKKNQAEKHKKPEPIVTRKLIYSSSLTGKSNYLQFLPVMAALAAGIYFVYSSFISNGSFGFPLDDSWIHLTFAKNLFEYGSFSYYKDELTTSGSTSPIYTLLVSVFYIISKNEFIISYLIGIAFGALLVYIVMKLFQKIIHTDTGETSPVQILVFFAALLVALQPKLNLINVSGMETSMFIFLIAAGLYAYISKKMVMLGILMGLAVWCRPDGLVLWGAVIFDYFLQEYFFRKSGKEKTPSADEKPKKIITAFSVALIFLTAYFTFNYFLSGSILPNTYSAKLEYYRNNDRASFLENEVIGYFTQDEFSLLWIPFLVGIIGILKSLLKKEYNGLLVLFFFIIGLIVVYYIKLPFAHRFGRYLMPVIPFYIIIAASGVKLIIDFISVRMKSSRLPDIIFILFVLSSVGFSVHHYLKSSEEYAFFCRYHNERHVAAGNWLKKNTDESAVVATHDIGAIAFYSERKIIDMAGLITPELIDQINKPSYSEYLNKFLAGHKIDYIAALRNWFEVVNDNPVYLPVNEAEFLEVFKYEAGKTHIQPKQVSYLNQAAVQMAQKGSVSNAAAYLNQSLRLDNKSSQTYYLLGAVYEMNKDYRRAGQNFSKAITLFPEYAEAYYGLAQINFELNKIEESKKILQRCLTIKPDFPPAVQLKSRLNPPVIN